jgi:hypothetical protein
MCRTVHRHCFNDPRQSVYLRPYNALMLELLVLTSQNLDQQFIAAFQWLYLSTNRRRCKAAVAGLYELARARFTSVRGTFCRVPGMLFPSVELHSSLEVVKQV